MLVLHVLKEMLNKMPKYYFSYKNIIYYNIFFSSSFSFYSFFLKSMFFSLFVFYKIILILWPVSWVW